MAVYSNRRKKQLTTTENIINAIFCMQKIPASGDVMKAALRDIAQAIHASGIPVINLTGES